MGVDRTLAMFQGKKSVFETELFWPVIERLQEISGKKYGAEPVLDM
jgi:alanyl-tRNA synthetase